MTLQSGHESNGHVKCIGLPVQCVSKQVISEGSCRERVVMAWVILAAGSHARNFRGYSSSFRLEVSHKIIGRCLDRSRLSKIIVYCSPSDSQLYGMRSAILSIWKWGWLDITSGRSASPFSFKLVDGWHHVENLSERW